MVVKIDRLIDYRWRTHGEGRIWWRVWPMISTMRLWNLSMRYLSLHTSCLFLWYILCKFKCFYIIHVVLHISNMFDKLFFGSMMKSWYYEKPIILSVLVYNGSYTWYFFNHKLRIWTLFKTCKIFWMLNSLLCFEDEYLTIG